MYFWEWWEGGGGVEKGSLALALAPLFYVAGRSQAATVEHGCLPQRASPSLMRACAARLHAAGGV
jgi:hypothetical protein